MTFRTSHNGSALITCVIVLMTVSTLAVALAGVSTANLQIAQNQRRANQSFANAESGLEVMRYWLARVKIPSSIPPSEYLASAIADLQSDLEATTTTNMVIDNDGSISSVVLDPNTGGSFQGHLSSLTSDPTILKVTVTGISGNASRTITVHFHIDPYRFPIFNYGMALKGPLVLPGNPKFLAASQGWEADMYVESANSTIAVDIGGNATFAGNIDLGNPLGTVNTDGTLNIAGQIETLAEEDRPEFPVADVEHFRQYATGPVIDSSTDLSGASMTLTNAVIAPGTNPNFPGNVTIQGILFIEAPNIVTFSHNTSLQGLIVAAGDVNDPGTNQINFGDPAQPSVPSNFSSGPYPSGSQFDAMRDEVGSCILAPGFGVSFWKNFSAINGVIAASGLYFDMNASANINGTLINYSEDPTTVNGNISFTFDRAAMVEIPAGFDLLRVLNYDPASYTIAL